MFLAWRFLPQWRRNEAAGDIIFDAKLILPVEMRDTAHWKHKANTTDNNNKSMGIVEGWQTL